MQIVVEVPEAVARQDARELAERARLLLIVDEVRAGRMSRAGAASALGVPLDEFLIAAGRHGLNAIDYDPDDFRQELDDIRGGGR